VGEHVCGGPHMSAAKFFDLGVDVLRGRKAQKN
jgi:hypothetical protein